MSTGVLVLDLQGTELTTRESRLLQLSSVAGVILFSRNFHNRKQLSTLISAIRGCSPHLLIMADQEGGRVQRFRGDGFSAVPSMGAIGSYFQAQPDKALTLAKEVGWLLAAELLATGVDLGLSPVLDLDRGISRVIGDRGFSGDSHTVSTLAHAFIAGQREAGMASVGKHFPGHGGTALDSHTEMPVDRRDMSAIDEDLAPYRALAADSLDAVMTAHVTFPASAPEPAVYSSYWQRTVLREQLGFQGAILSDCLSMAGARTGGVVSERAVKALQAGSDIALICNDSAGAEQAAEALLGYPHDGSAHKKRLEKLRGKRADSWDQLELTEKRKRVLHRLGSEIKVGG